MNWHVNIFIASYLWKQFAKHDTRQQTTVVLAFSVQGCIFFTGINVDFTCEWMVYGNLKLYMHIANAKWGTTHLNENLPQNVSINKLAYFRIWLHLCSISVYQRRKQKRCQDKKQIGKMSTLMQLTQFPKSSVVPETCSWSCVLLQTLLLNAWSLHYKLNLASMEASSYPIHPIVGTLRRPP